MQSPATATKPGAPGGGGGPAPAPASWAIGGNVGLLDWAPSPFNDAVKSSRGFGAPDEWAENPALPRDADGWPMVASRIVIVAAHERPGTEWQAGVWKGRFRGRGRLAEVNVANGQVPEASIVVQGEGDDAVVTFDWIVTGSPFLALRFDDGIRDLRIVRPGADLDDHALLHPAALDYYKQFHTLRFVDFVAPNWEEDAAESTWSTRQPAAKWHGRKSWEAMCLFFKACFEAPGSKVKGIWWNIPYRYDEESMLAMGRAMKTLLPSGALKFPEFSNELWNRGSYPAKYGYFEQRATTVAAHDSLIATPATDSVEVRTARLWALMSARMARAMKTAFADEFGVTLFPVMASQFQRIGLLRDVGLPWLALPAQSTVFRGPPKKYIGSLGIAPYLMGDEADTAPDAAALLAGLRSGYEFSLAQVTPQLALWKQLRSQYGIARLDAYEWQLHPHGETNADVKLAAMLHPEAGNLVTDLAHAMRDAGVRTMCYYKASPQPPLSSESASWLWPLNFGFSTPPTYKYAAVKALIIESGQ